VIAIGMAIDGAGEMLEKTQIVQCAFSAA